MSARLGDNEKTLILIEVGINDSIYVQAEEINLVSPDHYKHNIMQLINKSKQHKVE